MLQRTSLRIALLIGLAIVFTIGLSFATLEIPRLLVEVLRPIMPDPGYDPAAVEQLIQQYHLRAIGYACLGIILALIVAGFAARKKGLSSAGAVLMFLPTFGYFAGSMFFLAGIGILRVPWMPIWSASYDLLKLGDIVYLPYMIVTYPLFLLFGSPISGADFRRIIGVLILAIGLFIFLLGTITWLYGKYQKKEVIDFWMYKYSRHPQYVGFIVWSYGVMVLAALTPVVRGGVNPGASLPWVVSSLVIIGIAMNEEITMVKKYGSAYLRYQERVPLMLPVGRFISSLLSAPCRIVFRTDMPQNRTQIAVVLLIYFLLLSLLSLPFVLLPWPPSPGWSSWPS